MAMIEYVPVVRIQIVRERSLSAEPTINNTAQALELAKRFFKDLATDREVVGMATLDTKHHVLSVTVVTQGTLDTSLVHPRETFKLAILESAASILLFHNHPSGDPTPSNEDIRVTQAIAKAGDILGIRLLDHLIVGEDIENRAISLRETHPHAFNG